MTQAKRCSILPTWPYSLEWRDHTSSVVQEWASCADADICYSIPACQWNRSRESGVTSARSSMSGQEAIVPNLASSSSLIPSISVSLWSLVVLATFWHMLTTDERGKALFAMLETIGIVMTSDSKCMNRQFPSTNPERRGGRELFGRQCWVQKGRQGWNWLMFCWAHKMGPLL